MAIHRLTGNDLPRLRQFWIDHWGGEEMVVHSEIFRPEQLQGFVVEENDKWLGLVTFYFKDQTCEIMSLNSLRENKGIGTKLIEKTIKEAKNSGCERVFLVTTNDNLRAIGFYQKRGFELAAVHRGAVTEARKIKTGIPLFGENNIPLRDEIDLELLIK